MLYSRYVLTLFEKRQMTFSVKQKCFEFVKLTVHFALPDNK